MKKILAALALGAVLPFLGVSAAEAAPPEKNPQVVSYYEEGLHALPFDQTIWKTGADVVMRRGHSGNFQQWYYGEGIGYHSVWNVAKKDTCPPNWVLIPDANPAGDYAGWGHHLVEGADYCVMTNEFAVGKGI